MQPHFSRFSNRIYPLFYLIYLAVIIAARDFPQFVVSPYVSIAPTTSCIIFM